jgi:hypothetical protein
LIDYFIAFIDAIIDTRHFIAIISW